MRVIQVDPDKIIADRNLEHAAIRYGRARRRMRSANLEIEAAQKELDEARDELNKVLGENGGAQ